METKLLPDEETLRQDGSADPGGTLGFSTAVICKAKDKLRGLWVGESESPVGPVSASTDPEPAGGVCHGSRVLLLAGVLLVLLLMVMLLLWNYKCIVIDQLCQGNREMLTPMFKDN